MIEIQCNSCHTRYRVDERVLPEDAPTFKCSRCGHVFTADPVKLKNPKAQDQSKPAKADAARSPKAPGAQSRPIFGKREEPAAPEPQAQPRPAAPKESPPPHPGIFMRRPVPPEPAPEPQQQSAAAPEPPPPVRAPEAEEQPKPKLKSATPDDFAEQIRAFVDAVNPKPSAEPVPATPPPATPEPPHPGPEPLRSAGSVPPRMKSPPPQPQQSSEAPREQRLQQDRFTRANEPDNNEAGENLSFDFNDESGPDTDSFEEAPAPEQWSVGEEFEGPRAQAQAQVRQRMERLEPFGPAPGPERPPFAEDMAFVHRATMHSAGFFIGIFFFVAVIFAALALSIGAAPSASASLLRGIPIIGPSFETPASLESLVGIGDVQSHFETLKDGNAALIITGVAKNGTSVPLHVVQLGAHLLDPAKNALVNGATFCGTTISAKMISEMTPHELEFLQGVDPPKSFVLAPDATAPFMLVFANPPKNVSSFALAVAKAEPAASPQASPSPAPQP